MSFFFPKKRPPENPLIKELRSVRLELESAYSVFENAVDPDLVSSSIYHINAVQERYQYLLKQIKQADAAMRQSTS